MARRRRWPCTLFALLLGLGLASCSDLGDPLAPAKPDPDDEEPPPPAIGFAAAVLPILQGNCTGCHAPDMTVHANLVGAPAGGYGGLFRVAAGDTAASVLYQKVNGNPAFGARMPFGGQLLPDQIALIGQWITEGALDN